jgi:outer membrane lipoprotein-sorting protein
MNVQRRLRAAVAVAVLVSAATVTLATAASQRPSPPAREAASAEASAPGSFDERYRRGQQANAGLKTLTAQFTEVTTSSLLIRPLVSQGTIAVQRPARVILRYTEPERRIVLIDGNRMTMTWPSRNLKQESDVRRAQERVQRFFVEGNAADLRREFDVEPRDTSERPGTDEVSLRPRRRQIRETLSRLDLWIDPTSSLLAAMRMTFVNGDTKTMTFEQVRKNPLLDANAFSVAE